MRGLYGKHVLFSPVLFAAWLLSVNVSVTEAATLKQVRVVKYGHNDANTIKSPIYVCEGVTPLAIRTFNASYDKKAKVVRGVGSMFTRGPSLDVDKSINLASLFAESLQAEAKAMGYPLAASDAAGESWSVSGDLKDIYIESWQITSYGAIQFYGFMDLALEIQGPNAVAVNRHYRVHAFHVEPGGPTFSRAGKAEAALATLLVNSAQEVLSRLNREFFKAAISPEIDQRVEALSASGIRNHEADLHCMGLAGTPAAVTALLELLPKEKDSDWRSLIINALARAGSPDAVAPLTERYAQEEELGRWYTLKAMDYIGSEPAMALIRDKGLKDEEYSVKSLAARILAEK